MVKTIPPVVPRCPVCGLPVSEHVAGIAPGAVNIGVDYVDDCARLNAVTWAVEDWLAPPAPERADD